jgi:hypothetical protein
VAGISYPVQLASIQAYVRQVNGGPRQLTRTEREVIDDYAAMIVSDIEDAWPVDTSTSRDAWTYEVRGQADWVGFVIENDVDYVEYVHYAGQPAEPPLWETLLPATVQAYAGDMLAAIRAEVDRSQKAINANRTQGGRGLLDVLQRSSAWIRRVVA